MRDDVAPVEKANVDDVMEEDDDEDPNQYINTGCDDAQQYNSDYEGADELMMPDLPEPECPTADCKKSLFMRSLEETPPDAASTHQEQRRGRPLIISPTTLGVWLGKVWRAHYRHPPRSKGGDRKRKVVKAPELLQAASRSPGR